MNEIEGIDKLAHLLIYGILGLLIYRVLTILKKNQKITVIIATLLFVALAGAFDEFHQLSTPGRTFSLFDLLADVSGAGMAIIVFYFLTDLGKQG